MNLIETVGDELERLAQPLLERGLQPLVHGRSHQLELLRVVAAQRFEALLDRRAHRLEPLLVALCEHGEALVLDAGVARELILQRLRELREVGRELAAGGACSLRALAARLREIRTQLALEPLVLPRQRFESQAQVRAVASALRTRAQAQEDENQKHAQR